MINNAAPNPPAPDGAQRALVHRAILVMDSRNVVRGVRGPGQPLAAWSRLYQAGPYHLDMSLKPDEGTVRLLGQLVSQRPVRFEDASVRLKVGDRVAAERPLELSGRFALVLEPAQAYSLELDLGSETVLLARLESN